MRYVIEHSERRRIEVSAHPLYAWLRSDSVPLADRFAFAPVFVNFIMTFSDMNRWFMRYSPPQSELERAINRHTYEDETHSRLFLEDWKKLGFDQRLGWTASDVIWWYFAAPETEIFREYGMEIMKMAALHEDPLLRFAFMDAIEACGNVFFSATAPVATQLGEVSGHSYRYFGVYHLEKEMGHLIGHRVFEDVELDEERRRKAIGLVDRIFDMFVVENDRMLRYAEGLLRGEGPRRDLAPRRDEEAERREGPPVSVEAPSRRPEVHVTARNALVQRALDARKRATAGHKLFQWMQESGELPPERKLQRLLPLWTPDVMGYRDLNVYALSYRDPADKYERALNRWAAKLGTHYKLFMHDWSELGMDRLLRFSASDALSFYGLSKQTEIQRRSMSMFTKLAYAYPQPALRFWLIEALEASGEAFFHNTSLLAEKVERQTGKRLDYLANRHSRAHPELPRDDEADSVAFKCEELADSGREIAIGMVETVFDCLDQQLSLSLDLVGKDVFGFDSR